MGVRYQFDADEMNGTKLMKNFSWIAQTNDILSRMITDDDDNEGEHHDEDRTRREMEGAAAKEEKMIPLVNVNHERHYLK